MARIRALDTETVRLYELVELVLAAVRLFWKLFHCERSLARALTSSMLGHEHSHDVLSSVSTERMTKAARSGLVIHWLA